MSKLDPSAFIACKPIFLFSVPWCHLTPTKQRLFGLEGVSGPLGTVVSLEKCRLRRLVPMVTDIFGYKIERRIGSLSVDSRCGCGNAVEEGVRDGREDTVGVFVDMSGGGGSLGVIDSWAGG